MYVELAATSSLLLPYGGTLMLQILHLSNSPDNCHLCKVRCRALDIPEYNNRLFIPTVVYALSCNKGFQFKMTDSEWTYVQGQLHGFHAYPASSGSLFMYYTTATEQGPIRGRNGIHELRDGYKCAWSPGKPMPGSSTDEVITRVPTAKCWL